MVRHRLGAAPPEVPYRGHGVRFARVLFGFTLLYFGLAHFVFLKETASDVLTWLPWHVAWAYTTGVAFIAAGLAILIGWYARLAGVLSTVQIGMFVLLVWVPQVVAGPRSASMARNYHLCRANDRSVDGGRFVPRFAVKSLLSGDSLSRSQIQNCSPPLPHPSRQALPTPKGKVRLPKSLLRRNSSATVLSGAVL